MANVDAAFGLKPVRHSRGGTIRQNAYSIASGYGTDIFTGDPVKSTGTGRNIEIGTAGGTILGVFAGCNYINAQGEPIFSPYWPSGTVATEVEALVFDDPDLIFAAQASGSIAEADIRLLADLAAGTGNVKTGRSGWEVGASAGSEAQVKLLGLHNVSNNAYGANAVVELLIAEHELRGATTEV